MQYNFYDLRRRPRGQSLPADVNGFVETYAKRLGGQELVAALAHVKEKRLYGNLVFTDPEKRVVTGIFEFQSGICKEFKLVEYPTPNTFFQRNIKNETVEFKNEKKQFERRKEIDNEHDG